MQPKEETQKAEQALEPAGGSPLEGRPHLDKLVAPSTNVEELLALGSKMRCQRLWHVLTAKICEWPCYVPPTIMPSGSHPRLSLQLSGAIHLTIDKSGRPRQSHRVGAGAPSMSGANQPDVEVEWRSESSDPVRFMTVYMDHALLAKMAAVDAGLDVARLELRDNSSFDDPLLLQLLRALTCELRKPESQSELYAETAARMLIMQLIRRHGRVRALEAKASATALSAKSLRRLGDYVRKRLHEPIALGDLAAVAGISPYQFSRAFRRTTGQSPNQYVITQRMARAAHLLRRTQLTVAHIASLVGYQSASQFSALFKRHTGRAPAAYGRQTPGRPEL